MVENDDEVCNSKPILKIHANNIRPTIALTLNLSSTFSAPMKRSVRPVFTILLLIVIAATLCCRFAIRSVSFRSIYLDGGAWGSNSFNPGSETSNPIMDIPLFNSTLLKLAEIERGEEQMKQQIGQLLEGNNEKLDRYRTYAMWRRYGVIATRSGGTLRNSQSPQFNQIYLRSKRVLGDWARKRRFQSDIMSELVDQVKAPIDKHNGLVVNDRKYSSCAVVGNSGILLSTEYGDLIDSHEAVIRLNNARIGNFQRNVGSKTTFSFVNSNIVHLCARREGCLCHPYGSHVPIAMYICQPVHFLDYTVCNSSHKSPLIVTDPRFDVLCSRIVNYYSLKRYAEEGPANKTLEHWRSSHDGSLFHYSSGMQAVMLALGICDRVSIFGFGKATNAKHHYHTNQKAEFGLHDYEAEYDFYRDLAERPRAVPFVSGEFKFPPVVIHH